MPEEMDILYTEPVMSQWIETETVVEDGITYLDTYTVTETTTRTYYSNGSYEDQPGCIIRCRTGRNPQTGNA
jgi:hypothetical protein